MRRLSTTMSIKGRWPCGLLGLLAVGLAQGARVYEDEDQPCTSIYAPFHTLTKVSGIGSGTAKVIGKARFCPFQDEADFKMRYEASNGKHWSDIKSLLDSKDWSVGNSGGLDVNKASWWDLKKMETISDGVANVIVAARNCKLAGEDELKDKILDQKGGKSYWKAIKQLLDKEDGEGGLCFKDYVVEEDVEDANEAGNEEDGGKVGTKGGDGGGPGHEAHGGNKEPIGGFNPDVRVDAGDAIEEKPGVQTGKEPIGGINPDVRVDAGDASEEKPGGGVTAESIAASAGSKIKVVGFPESDFISLGDAKWEEAKNEFSVIVRRQPGSKGYAQIYSFKDDPKFMKITGDHLEWTCYHFSHVVITGTLSDGKVENLQMEKTS